MNGQTDFDYSTLGWVKRELDSTLRDAAEALEAYADEPEDRAQLQFCVTHLHQIHGILQMLELSGACMLAEEMESLGRRLLEDRASGREHACEVLMRSILQLRDYLDWVHGGHRDRPVVLLPIINELRAARGDALLTEYALFNPTLDASPSRPRHSRPGPEPITVAAAEERPRYLRGLAAYLRGRSARRGLATLLEALDRLDRASADDRRGAPWWIAAALVEGLREQAVQDDMAVRRLLAQVEREMKRLVADADHAPSPQLVKNLLYYVARTNPAASLPRVAAVRELYGLEGLVAGGEELESARRGLLGPGQDALSGVATALREDLASVKDLLDLYARGAGTSDQQMDMAAETLRRTSDTLGMLGLGGARRLLQQQADLLAVLPRDAPDEDMAMKLAESLLHVESAIIGLEDRASGADAAVDAEATPTAGPGEYQRVYQSTLREALKDVAQAKESVVRFIESQDHAELQGVGERFDSVRGALRVTNLLRAAAIVDAAERYIQGHAAPGQALPDAEALDDLADAITGLEYYLEALIELRPGSEQILEVAENSLRRLGFAPESGDSLALAPGQAPAGEAGRRGAEPAETDAPAADAVRSPAQEAAPAARDPASERQDYARKRGRVDLEIPVRSEEVDPEILEIFVDEAGELLETLGECFPAWRADPGDEDSLATTRRMFHTLKGSGRLAGALLLGELAWAMENTLNRVLDGSVEPTPELMDVVGEAIERIPALVAELDGGPPSGPEVRDLMARAVELTSPPMAEFEPAAVALAVPAAPEAAPADLVDPALGEIPPPPLVEQEPQTAPGEQTAEPEPASEPAAPAMDPVLYDIFSREVRDHLGTVADFLERALERAPDALRVNEDLIRALHTLSGSARMASVDPVAGLGRDLEDLARQRYATGVGAAGEDLAVLGEGAALVEDIIDALAVPGRVLPEVDPLRERIQALSRQAPAESREIPTREPQPGAGAGLEPTAADRSTEDQAAEPSETPPPAEPAPMASHAPADDADRELMEIFLEESRDLFGQVEETVQRWEDRPEDTEALGQLHRSLHTLKGGARLAGFENIGTLAHSLETLFADVAAGRVVADDGFFDVLHGALDRISDLIEGARAGTEQPPAPGVLQEIENLEREPATQPPPTPVAPPEPAPAPPRADDGLLDVFLEEAGEILGTTEGLLHDWREQPDDDRRIGELQRALHTLKGGARMAGVQPVADLSHALETMVMAVREGRAQPGEALFDLLEEANDRLVSQRESALRDEPVAPAEDLLEAAARLQRGEAAPPAPQAVPEASPEPDPALGEVPPEAAAEPAPAQAPEPAAAADTQARPDDAVRVRSELLDNLVKYAGEVSIYRARMEQQAGAIGFNLSELGQTVNRVREQLRTLELETETQILYRYEREGGAEPAERANFDPLELDRFSRIQELSRALGESVNDLHSIQDMLGNLNRESETLLLQQSRVNTDLQDGLMRTRMVPFANLVPRMRRIVRQAARETGKKAQLRVEGAQGEMDRNVLERVVAPMEHMLRNAVAHGIEPSEDRLEWGKPESGTITVAFSREGADVVIRVSDDGAGLDVEAIRRKALDRGLIAPDAGLGDRDIIQFVMQQGFSTAKAVTQLAGRGVGLDVANSEIKQLGGTLELDTVEGVGTEFTVRLPFTLALNHALLVQTGDEVYAIPLSSIEGVVRIANDDLARHLGGTGSGVYDYAGQRYQVRSLNAILGAPDPTLPGPGKRAPMILVHTGEQRLALHVDGLIGSREIVVKAAGPQISSVPGIFGATILADGRVVLILDLSSLVRLGVGSDAVEAGSEAPVPVAERSERDRPLVMVVDDSITMRKVASRLLERNSMEPLTAKDGVDAVARLQETIPDVMLLDIEMPRMDGYELATHMRNDERLRDVPIIMITSRTGEKHRERAMQIGVDHYIGKPYQESELLATLRGLLERRRGGG